MAIKTKCRMNSSSGKRPHIPFPLGNPKPKEALEKIEMPQNTTIVKLEKSGHMGFIEEKEESVKSLKEFVSSCSA